MSVLTRANFAQTTIDFVPTLNDKVEDLFKDKEGVEKENLVCLVMIVIILVTGFVALLGMFFVKLANTKLLNEKATLLREMGSELKRRIPSDKDRYISRENEVAVPKNIHSDIDGCLTRVPYGVGALLERINKGLGVQVGTLEDTNRRLNGFLGAFGILTGEIPSGS